MRRLRLVRPAVVVILLALCSQGSHNANFTTQKKTIPVPLVAFGRPVDWWFVFKFNAGVFPDCAGGSRACPFGGTVQKYKVGQQYAFASNESPTLTQGSGCAGNTNGDPIGATFEQVYNGSFYYVIWNDQFYEDPKIARCTTSCGAPWGHSKGMLAWNDACDGFVMQVSTPSWPASGSKSRPRKTQGNTLGCVKDDDVEVSQHFFALKLNKDDLLHVLEALQNASVVTDPSNPQIVSNGGPADVQGLVRKLGTESKNTAVITVTLSSGVRLISKPSKLNVPPWQMVSALLGGISLRTATWWANPEIPTTTNSTRVKCWDKSLAKPGAVQIATTGTWNGKTIGLTGGSSPDHNHAKIGVSTSGNESLAIFGDMNQQGSLSGPNCKSSQNGRGGLFYVIDNKELSTSVSQLITGKTASTRPPTTARRSKP